jgi:hypothetical protein
MCYAKVLARLLYFNEGASSTLIGSIFFYEADEKGEKRLLVLAFYTLDRVTL